METRHLVSIGGSLALLMATFPALTQQPVLEEILVTAKQREQNLQEVPLSISVFSDAELERLGVQNVQDLAMFTPNFNIYSGNGRQDATAINVRGLSPNTSDERYQPVSFFVDGIFMGGITVGLDTSNVERIEVIKGPQSSTFGRATYAGAIDFVTKTPSLEEFSGRINAELSSNTFDNSNYIVSGLIDGPIVEGKVSGSLFVKKQLDDGFDQVEGGQFPEVGEQDTTIFNAVIYSQLSEDTSLKVRVIYAEEKDQEPNFHTTHPLYWEQNGANIVTLPSGAVFIEGTVPDPIRDRIRGVDLPAMSRSPGPMEGGFDRKRFFVSAILEHEFDNGMNFSYRGNYLLNEYAGEFDFRGRTYVGVDPIFGRTQPLHPGESLFNFALGFPFQEEFEENSHQFRLLSPSEERLRWSVGAYIYTSRDSNFQSRTDRTPPAGNPEQQTRGDEDIDNYAVFGSVAYDLQDDLTVSFEGRVQEEEVAFRKLDGFAVSSGSRLSEDLVADNTSFEPRLTLDYRVNDDQLLYALLAKGTKSGRWNTGTTAPFQADGTRPTAGYLYAPPEELYNYEFGSKSTLMDGRAILNVALFYQDVKDQQLRQTVLIDEDLNNDGISNDFLNQIFTGGDSRIYGFELEGTMQVTDRLTLRGAIGYADHQFKDDIPPSADFDLFDYTGGRSLKGNTSVNVPKVTGAGSAEYTAPVMGGRFNWRVRGDVVFTGKKYVELANVAQIDDFYLFNLRTALETESWGINLFVNNVLDDKTPQGSGLTNTATCEFERNGPNLPAYNNAQRCIYLLQQRGREWGVSASLFF